MTIEEAIKTRYSVRNYVDYCMKTIGNFYTLLGLWQNK